MRQLLATLRYRPAPLVGVLVALVATASIVTWTFSLGMAGSTTVLATQRLAGTAVIVSGRPDVAVTSGHDPSTTEVVPLTSYRPVATTLAARLRSIPGVRAAIADTAVPLALTLPSGRIATGTSSAPLTAYGWPSAQLTPFTLRTGHPPGPGQLVIGAGLAQASGLHTGDRVRIVGRPVAPLTVVGIAAAPPGNPAGNGAVFVSAPEAAALSGHPHRADLIGVVAQPGTAPRLLADRIRAAVAGQHLQVITGTGRGAVENLTAASDLQNLSDLAGGTGVTFVLIALFVAASAVALSVAERARTMALLRSIGATPGQVRRMVMAELAVLGVLAGGIGYLTGTWLAAFSVHGLAAHQFVPAATHVWSSPIELLPAAGVAVLVAELAGALAARRASRIRPTAALQEASLERRTPRPVRLILGLTATAGGVALSIVVLRQPDASQQLEDAELVVLAFMAAVAFLGPYLITATEAIFRLPVRLLGGTPAYLASAGLRTHTRRMAAAAVAIALPVCFAGAIITIDATQARASATQSRARLAASAVVTAAGPGLDPSVLTAIRSQPDVTDAVGLIPTTVYVPYPGAENTTAEAVTPGPYNSLLHLGVTSGSLAHFGPGDIALSQLLAGKGGMDVHVGQTITTFLADGTTYRATVTAIFSRSLGFADALVPSNAAGGGHLGATTFNEVLVSAPPGAEVATELAGMRARYPAIQIASRRVANAQDELLTAQTSYVNNLLLGIVGLLAAVALVNALVMATFQGRDELVLLRRVGATKQQLLAMTGWQAAHVAAVGIVLGAGAAAAAILAVAKAFTGTWTPSISWTATATILGLVALLTGLATLVPTASMLMGGETP